MTHDNVTDLILWKLYIEGVNAAKKLPPDPAICDVGRYSRAATPMHQTIPIKGDAYGDLLSLSRFELDFCCV